MTTLDISRLTGVAHSATCRAHPRCPMRTTTLGLALLLTLSACSLAGQGQFTVTDPEAPKASVVIHPLLGSSPEAGQPETGADTVAPEDTDSVNTDGTLGDTGEAAPVDTTPVDTDTQVTDTVLDTPDAPLDTVDTEVLVIDTPEAPDTTDLDTTVDTDVVVPDTTDTTPAPPEPRLCVTPTMTWDTTEVVITVEGDTSAGWLEVHLPGGVDFMLIIRSGGAPQHIDRRDLRGLSPVDVGFVYYSSAIGEAIGWGPEILPGAAVRIVPLDLPVCFF